MQGRPRVGEHVPVACPRIPAAKVLTDHPGDPEAERIGRWDMGDQQREGARRRVRCKGVVDPSGCMHRRAAIVGLPMAAPLPRIQSRDTEAWMDACVEARLTVA